MSERVLRPDQEIGVEWLMAHDRICLWDDPGLGKAVMGSAACERLGLTRVAVACPASAVPVWRHHLKLWAPSVTDIRIETYDRLARSRELRMQLEAMQPEVLILDEHHRLKTPTAKRTQAVLGKNYQGGIIGAAERVWAMSGSPSPNHVGELFPVVKALFPGELHPRAQTYAEFLYRYCHLFAGKYGVKVVGLKREHLAELHAMLRRVGLRRTDAELKLPPLLWDTVLIPAEGVDMTEIRALEAEHGAALRRWIEGGARGDEPESPVALFRHAVGRAKVAAAAQLFTEELHGGVDKMVVFAYHHDVIAALTAQLAAFHPVVYTGNTSKLERERVVAHFQTEATCRVFIGQLQACGEAITLNAAHHVRFVETSFVPGENYQAAKRCHRGATVTRPTFAHVVALDGSLDEGMAESTARKARNISLAIDPQDPQSPQERVA